jgi:hypothetical protein
MKIRQGHDSAHRTEPAATSGSADSTGRDGRTGDRMSAPATQMPPDAPAPPPSAPTVAPTAGTAGTEHLTAGAAEDAAPSPTTTPTAGTDGSRPAADGTRGSGTTTGTATGTTSGDSKLAERLDHAVGTFVDDPRGAVAEAESVLDEAARRLVAMLEERRRSLHADWHREDGSPSGTEELRVALTRYRDMAHKLLDLA